MTLIITLELTSEQEQRLRKKASRAGLDLAEYLKRIADRSATKPARCTRKLSGPGPSVQPAKNDNTVGAKLVAELTQQGIIGAGYSDVTLDAPDLARKLHNEVWRVRDESDTASS